jgi:NADPH:quinone reductase
MSSFNMGERNQGDDVAGFVHKVGYKFIEFYLGDRIAVMRTPGGGYAEYALGPAHMTFHVPSKMSFEEVATVPLAEMMVAAGLFVPLGLP